MVGSVDPELTSTNALSLQESDHKIQPKMKYY